jgi:hypothetical protein
MSSNGNMTSAYGPLAGDQEGLSLASRLIHADDHISVHRAVAPAMHVSTTFRYNDDPELLDRKHLIDVSTDGLRRNCEDKLLTAGLIARCTF